MEERMRRGGEEKRKGTRSVREGGERREEGREEIRGKG